MSERSADARSLGSLALFATAVRGAPVELITGDANTPCLPDALGALAAVFVPDVLRLNIAVESGLGAHTIARILRDVAWARAGTGELDMAQFQDRIDSTIEPRRTHDADKLGDSASALDRFLAGSRSPDRLTACLAACESIRIDAMLQRLYPGIAGGFDSLRKQERQILDNTSRLADTPQTVLIAAIEQLRVQSDRQPHVKIIPDRLQDALRHLRLRSADVNDSARCALWCEHLLGKPALWAAEQAENLAGETFAVDSLSSAIGTADEPINAGPDASAAAGTDTSQTQPGQVSSPGHAGASGMAAHSEQPIPGAAGTADAHEPADALGSRSSATDTRRTEPTGESVAVLANGIVPGRVRSLADECRVDEWDYLAQAFRPGWCRIIESQPQPRQADAVDNDTAARLDDYFGELMRREPGTARRIRQQFAMLRQQATQRRRAFGDGEDIDLDSLVDTRVERRAGRMPDELRSWRREPLRRDVAVALLLDVSASTDFPLPDPNPVEALPPALDEEDDPFLWSPTLYEPPPASDAPAPRRVIDVERDAMALLAQAFDALGDRFALYAFSGSGREQVDFLSAKEFDQALTAQTWRAIAAIEPMRSTRMGAAIRHAAARLHACPERTRVLIVVSDGYPDDVDYGPDRRSAEYGIHDTAHALAEARRLGVQTLMVTVEQAGHDYLRRICEPRRYLVIREVDTLAEQLAHAYRTLTESA